MNKIKWFSQDRFGMFIHWGLYSVCGGVWKNRKIKASYSEWLQNSERISRSSYARIAEQFNPTGFDAEQWVCEAQYAGMKYLVVTAKHHDGFCLWPTRCSPFNVMDATPYKRDILAELTNACRKYDIKIGFYYSHWQDWDGSGGDVIGDLLEEEEYNRPTQEEFEQYWQNKCLPQIGELIQNYNPDLLWFDSWGTKSGIYMTSERQNELIDYVQHLSSKCLVNSRICFDAPPERCDYLSMMDNTFPEKTYDKPWETSGTLNESWAYHKLDFAWKSTEQLIKNLVHNASFGGNYQLNVGPTGDGLFQPAAIKRLREIGNWMRVNAQSIYNTQAGPYRQQTWGTSTIRNLSNNESELYLHLWNVTPGTAMYLSDIQANITSAVVLETNQDITVETGSCGVWIHIPVELKHLSLPVIRLNLNRTV
jgi:alpha-L-fucosidase